jgi:hypothetical protein
MPAGKCPVCQNPVTHASGQSLEINFENGATLSGVSFQCPNPACNTVIGIQVDPLAYKREIVREVTASLMPIIQMHG